MRFFLKLVVAATTLLGVVAWINYPDRRETTGRFSHEAYVWQRDWNPQLKRALTQHAAEFHRMVVLAAEIRWDAGAPRLTTIDLDWSALRELNRPIGLALRIGPYRGPFTSDGKITGRLVDTSRNLLAVAKSNGLQISELQVDFDCPDARLAGYSLWLDALRPALNGIPLTITALPSWLNQSEFKSLVRRTAGFVLQVHGLQRPANPNHVPALCEPVLARDWVNRAAQFEVPFRVALPTYGYDVYFDSEDRFVGVSAESQTALKPAAVQVRRTQSDPVEMAALVDAWTRSRPALMRGVIWYRFPVETDRLNWRWSTLSAVIQGRAPVAKWSAVSQMVEPGLVEISLTNAGETEVPADASVNLKWSGTRLLSGDALGGYFLDTSAMDSARLLWNRESHARPVVPGETRVVAWLRLNSPAEVICETTTP